MRWLLPGRGGCMTPDDLAKDRAICDAAPDHLAKMVDDVGRIDLVSENAGYFGYDPIAIGVGEEFADFAIAARERLPEYISEAEKMQRRVAKVETAAAGAAAAAKLDPWGRAPAYRDGLQDALRILRGEK